MALAVVAMFLLTATGALLTPDADAGANDNQTYTIRMHNNDTFTYTPTTNYDGNGVSYSYDGYDQSGLNATISNSKTITVANPTASTAYTDVTLTASVSTPTSQSSYQKLSFDVYQRLAVQKSGSTITADSIYVPTGVTANSTVATYTLAGTAPVTISESHTVKLSGADSTNFTVTYSSNTWTIKAGSSITAGTYTVTLNASYTSAAGTYSNAISDSASATITIYVSANPTITPTSSYAIAGTATSQAITATGSDNFTYTGWSLSDVPSGHASKISIAASSGSKSTTLSVTNGFSNSDISSGDSLAVQFNIELGYTANGVNYTSTQAYTLNVYKALCFTSSPTSGTVTPTANSTDPSGLDIAITIVAQGATKITYDWGDGTIYSRDVLAEDATIYTASHKYDRPGNYFISATSENDFGKSTSYTLYSCGTGMPENSVMSSQIKADSVNGGADLRLSVYPVVAGTYSDVKFTWMYKPDGAQNPIVIDSEDKPEFVKDVGTVLVLDKSLTPYGTTFYAKISVKFQDQSVWKESSTVSYTYTDGTFFAEHGWLFLVFLILAILMLALWFFFGIVHPAVMVIAAVSAIMAILLFLCKDFAGIWALFFGR